VLGSVSTNFFDHTEPRSTALARRQVHFIHEGSNDENSAPARFQQIGFVCWVGDFVYCETFTLVFDNDFNCVAVG